MVELPKTLTNTSKLSFLVNLAASLTVPGDFAECGVYEGGTLLNLARARPNRKIYGFDTFTGLPASKWANGEPHKPEEFQTSFAKVRERCMAYPNIELVQGVFPESAAARKFKNKFAFVYLDFDFYQSTLEAIRWFRKRMPDGGVIVFDDYDWPFCPGVKRAILEEGLVVEEPVTNLAVWIKSEV